MKKIAVNKADANKRIAELTREMASTNWFVNIATKQHKDPEKIWIIVG